jgi:histidinol phosphatase-like enzyme
MKKKVIYIDIDGTICTQTDSKYEKAKPFKKAINKINKLYNQGNTIIVYTARFMGRTNNNYDKAYKLGYNFTLNQLKSWGLKFHELKMGKPQFDLLIDDKTYNYNQNWEDLL